MHPFDTLNQEIIACCRCPRLVAWREQVAQEKRKAYHSQPYWGKPVPGFGDRNARILVVGLAPGAHGSNRTGRQFTGDASGDFLFPALMRAGFASQANAESREDGLTLKNMYITASARCAPPQNKPTQAELHNCQDYLAREIQLLKPGVIVCLGRVAFERVLKILSSKKRNFSHGLIHQLPSAIIICSYHPSQQNTRTGKLTTEMFDQVWRMADSLANMEK